MRKDTHTVRTRGVWWRVLAAALPLLSVLFVSKPAHAYSWMIRHGYSGCPVCHADPSGGETLTAYGRAQSDLLLRMRYDGKKAEEAEPSPASRFLWFMDLPTSVLMGGSIRVASDYENKQFSVFPMQLDVYGQLRFGSFIAGGSLGVIKTPPGSLYGRTSQITTNQGDQYNLISRTFYVGYDLSNEFTLRVGRLNLPFGVRIPEHTMWVRQTTRTDRESGQEYGVALAYNAESLRGEFMPILGNYQINPDKFRERGYSGYLELMAGTRAAIGVSSFYTYAKEDRVTLETSVARGAHGPFTRIGVTDEFAILGEADLLTDSSRALGYVGFVQGDYEFVQGLHGMLTVEWQDQGQLKSEKVAAMRPRPGDGKGEMGLWVSANWFFLPHMDVRIDAIQRPSDFSLFTQLHAFL
ncbi:MAG TPA: hypothetical protein VMI54_29805 [Polyangiaceae bacterium]|nr:hypothetical protein [Polyangiaceae bacterium]